MKNNRLPYFLAKSLMFGTGFFLLFKDNGKNAWISVLLGTILGISVLYIYNLIHKKLNGESLTTYLQEKRLGKLYLMIFILFDVFLIIIILLILTTFVNSFYLINTPKFMVILPFVILAFYLAIKEKNILNNLSNLLFFFSIFVVTIFSILLLPYFDYTELLPFNNYNISSIILGSLVYASITSIPQILLIDYNIDFKYTLKYYLIASFFNLTITLGSILGLGDYLIKVYNYPEYDVLKQIKILDFIENIENIFF